MRERFILTLHLRHDTLEVMTDRFHIKLLSAFLYYLKVQWNWMFINPYVRHVFLKFEVRHIKDVRDKSFNRWSIMMQNMVSRFYSWLSLPTGNRRGLIIKPGKYQRSTQRCQHVSFGQYGVSNSCVLCTGKAKKENKNIQQRSLSGFTIPLY